MMSQYNNYENNLPDGYVKSPISHHPFILSSGAIVSPRSAINARMPIQLLPELEMYFDNYKLC